MGWFRAMARVVDGSRKADEWDQPPVIVDYPALGSGPSRLPGEHPHGNRLDLPYSDSRNQER